MQDYKKIDIKREDIIPTAERMRKDGRRLVMIHGYVDKEGQNVISYDFEVGDCVEAYTITGETSLPSISEIYDMAAVWPEKEINELMGVDFEGLDMSQRLFLPEDMLDERGQIIVTPISELRKD